MDDDGLCVGGNERARGEGFVHFWPQPESAGTIYEPMHGAHHAKGDTLRHGDLMCLLFCYTTCFTKLTCRERGQRYPRWKPSPAGKGSV